MSGAHQTSTTRPVTPPFGDSVSGSPASGRHDNGYQQKKITDEDRYRAVLVEYLGADWAATQPGYAAVQAAGVSRPGHYAHAIAGSGGSTGLLSWLATLAADAEEL